MNFLRNIMYTYYHVSLCYARAMQMVSKRTLRYIAVLLAGVIVPLLPYFASYIPSETKGDGKTLKVVIFDIGQGDSIFIQSPTGKQVLIDGGPDGTVLRRLASEMGYFDRTIDMVVATHEDRDHIGGLPDVFSHYHVGTFLRTENQGKSAEAHTIDDITKIGGSEIVYARRGMTFDLGASTTLTVLFPDRDPTNLEPNMSSIVAKLTYGTKSFLFTGDSPQEIEKYLVSLDAAGLQSTVLKLGHHGSRTSSSREYLEAVHPEYGVVSSGKHNRYGHPHKEVVDLLHELGIAMPNTAEEGSVVFETDGQTLVKK